MKKTACDKNNNNKNGGFSLVELIVVIAIMAVLTGIASMSVASVMGVSVKQCARDIQAAANQTRVSTLGKDEVIMTLTKGKKSDEAYYCTIVAKDGLGNSTENEEKIGKSNLDITFVLSDSKGNKTSDIKLNNTNSLTIKFNSWHNMLKFLYHSRFRGIGASFFHVFLIVLHISTTFMLRP